MKILSLPRGKGKTSILCDMCIKMDAYLVVKNKEEAKRVFNDMAWGARGLRFPITYYEASRMQGSWIKEVVVDNIDDFTHYIMRTQYGLNPIMGSIDYDFSDTTELTEVARNVREDKHRKMEKMVKQEQRRKKEQDEMEKVFPQHKEIYR
jgi:hypothetical protein